MYGADDSNFFESRPDVYFSREMGDALIRDYFKFIHPQMPVLAYSDVVDVWNEFWGGPLHKRYSPKGRGVFFVVLALGARVTTYQDTQNRFVQEDWGDYFAERADKCTLAFQEPSLRGTHFLLLKVRTETPRL